MAAGDELFVHEQFTGTQVIFWTPLGCRSTFRSGATVPSMATVGYRLEDQIGFLLRRAHQRHAALFHEQMIEGLTPTQFAALAKLTEGGPLSQNLLGRETAMDSATIKGVVSRLRDRGLVEARRDPTDRRRLTIVLTPEGQRLGRRCIKVAAKITEATLSPLDATDRAVLVELLDRIAGSA
jgi:DNA-binding MarR family transcriptional regulator